MNGQAIKQIVYVLTKSVDNPINGYQPEFNSACKYYLPALAQLEPTDQHFNDRHSVVWFFDDLYTEAHIFLQKLSGSTWVDVSEMTDNTYGTMYALGFFTNKFSERALGYQIEWSKVLGEEGPGIYRVRNSAEKSIGTYVDHYSFEFELMGYTEDRSDNTVRVEWNRNGVLGNRDHDEKVDDYGTINWYNSIRIPNSMFGFPTSDLVKDIVKYPNGEKVWISDKQEEELTWQIYQLPYYVHRFIQVDVMQSGPITVNDYNVLSPSPTVDRQVISKGGYKPEYGVGIPDRKANVTLTFEPYFGNLERKRE